VSSGGQIGADIANMNSGSFIPNGPQSGVLLVGDEMEQADV
jgi:hypothetical protein